jgi:hypothetical protein
MVSVISELDTDLEYQIIYYCSSDTPYSLTLHGILLLKRINSQHKYMETNKISV